MYDLMLNDIFPGLNFKAKGTHPPSPKKEILVLPIQHLLVEKVKMKKAGYWSNIKHRRQFLFAFAGKMGFDPMIKDNWKSKTFSIRANKVRNPLLLWFFFL